jgi:hypothetical protein
MRNIIMILMTCVLSMYSLSAYSQQMVVYNNYGYGSTPSVQYYTPSVWVPYSPMPQPYVVYAPVVPVYQHTHMVPVTTTPWQPVTYQWNYNIYHRRGCFGNYYYYYYR